MLKKLKDIRNLRTIIADTLLVAALAIIFTTTYEINAHLGLYVLSVELLAAAVMLVRSGEK